MERGYVLPYPDTRMAKKYLDQRMNLFWRTIKNGSESAIPGWHFIWAQFQKKKLIEKKKQNGKT
jgi:hypothetical protein